MSLHNDILLTLRQVVSELEHTRAWEVMSDELKGKVRAGIIRLEVSECPQKTFSAETNEVLKGLIRKEFDNASFLWVDMYVRVAKDLGYHDLAKEMEEDSRHD